MTNETENPADESVHNHPFAVIRNCILEDFSISPLDRFLLVYLSKHPSLLLESEDSRLRDCLSCEPEEIKFSLIFKELVDAGYIRANQLFD